MRIRLPDVPVLKTVPSAVPASFFNRVRLAQLRLGAPLQQLLGLRGLNFVLDLDVWVCVDRNLNDMPIVAWTQFNTRRSSLVEPVPCEVIYYHAYAGVIVKTVLGDIDRRLSDLLARHHPPRVRRRDNNKVIPLSRYK